jgi:hypothetical protein
VHWSIFTVSVANLVLIAVMVVIFGAALLLPFPRGVRAGPAAGGAADGAADGGTAAASDPADDGTAGMWTARVRRRALKSLPPGKLLPDTQPRLRRVLDLRVRRRVPGRAGRGDRVRVRTGAGRPRLVALQPAGALLNSLHLWSVELFMALLVIHLWGKFWMAAWRDRRTLTWITGVVAFAASVLECFTGYVSQQNFDSQWISTSGKDALNSVGVGAFFNVMNTGQMLMWHIVLLPLVLIAIVGAHVLLVRVRGVSHPIGTDAAATAGRRRSLARPEPPL